MLLLLCFIFADVKLYVDTMRDQLLQEVGQTIPFVTSSPTRGPQSEVPYTQLWGAAQSPDYGDMSVKGERSARL